MVARALAVVPVLLCGACTLVLDVDNLPPPTDAGIDAPPPIDANVDDLVIQRVEPATVLEGTGAGGGRPALLVLHGMNLAGNAMVTVDLEGPDPGEATLVDYAAATDSGSAAIAVRIPVLPELAAGATRRLNITVKQGMAERTASVMVMGLGELTLAGPTLTSVASVQTYSHIEITGGVHASGTSPVRLAATADIVISAKLDGNGVGDAPGPHGCAGGNSAGNGTCGGSAGRAGTSALGGGTGGGGGGFGATGTAGNGNAQSGMPGAASGRETLVPIVTDADVAGNRGNGGGGGGNLLGGVGPGGKGGGGGGVIFLEAGGDVTVMGGGAIEATGGAGTNGSGGGGGGSGGAILIRAGGAITAAGAWLSAAGGPKGTGTGTAGSRDGGAGGVGRIRVDAATGDVAAMATPRAFRGPSWDKATPAVVETIPNVTLLGQPGRAFPLRLNDDAVMAPATPGVDGKVMLRLPLVRGLNELCAIAEPGMLDPESVSCIEIFYTGG